MQRDRQPWRLLDRGRGERNVPLDEAGGDRAADGGKRFERSLRRDQFLPRRLVCVTLQVLVLDREDLIGLIRLDGEPARLAVGPELEDRLRHPLLEFRQDFRPGLLLVFITAGQINEPIPDLKGQLVKRWRNARAPSGRSQRSSIRRSSIDHSTGGRRSEGTLAQIHFNVEANPPRPARCSGPMPGA